jgi:triphosphoribosyl-dephospho-CoA synthase
VTANSGTAPAWNAALRAGDVATAAQLACLLEASAPKPGNVSPGRHFRDLRYEDFLASAAAIGPPLAEAGERPLGQTIRRALESTGRWARTNTNLGIVLLLAPIARAALLERSAPPDGAAPSVDLRERLRHVLASTTVDDAIHVYSAIRLAAPGGLGRVGEQDVAGEPTLTLLDAMRLARQRDSIAREYATSFELTFDTGAPALARARESGLTWDEAVVETYLALLASTDDTHITRRSGHELAAGASAQARDAVAAGGVRTSAGRAAIERMDRQLRDAQHAGNPGTSADLTAAAIFVVLLGGGWNGGDGGVHAAAR